MRRTRVLTIAQYITIALPIVGSALGIRYLVLHPKGANKVDIPHVSKEGVTGNSKKVAKKADVAPSGEDDSDDSSENAATAAAPVVVAQPSVPAPSAPAPVVQATASRENECKYVEYRGLGPQDTKVTKVEWSLVMDQFHDSKAKLLSWLGTHQKDFSDGQYQLLEKQVKKLKIQRPPAEEEPDLSWRGIGIYTQARDGVDPILRVGSGLIQLVEADPIRARFEMMRMVATAWSSCEIARVAGADPTLAKNPFSPMLSCLGVVESGCAAGGYSESAWALTTTVAASLATPSCKVGAFFEPQAAQCLDPSKWVVAERIPASLPSPAPTQGLIVEKATQ